MIRILPLQLDREMFCLYEDEKLLAKCFYSSETGEIFSIEDVDPVAAKPWHVAILKATMSSMDYAGVTLAWSRNEDLFDLLKILRFNADGSGRMTVPLAGYFDTACECGNHD